MENVRLIDANALEKRIRSVMGGFKAEMEIFLTLVDQAPTVYDIDKVVEEMKLNAEKMSETKFPHTYYKAIGTRKCEEIIRNGGMI